MRVAGVTIFQDDPLIRPEIFLSHEPVLDPLYTIPILHLPLVFLYNPLAQ
jgi:hypothetical protein